MQTIVERCAVGIDALQHSILLLRSGTFTPSMVGVLRQSMIVQPKGYGHNPWMLRIAILCVPPQDTLAALKESLHVVDSVPVPNLLGNAGHCGSGH